jgi:hypothetical protein
MDMASVVVAVRGVSARWEEKGEARGEDRGRTRGRARERQEGEQEIGKGEARERQGRGKGGARRRTRERQGRGKREARERRERGKKEAGKDVSWWEPLKCPKCSARWRLLFTLCVERACSLNTSTYVCELPSVAMSDPF